MSFLGGREAGSRGHNPILLHSASSPLPFIYAVLQNITHMIMCDGIADIYPSEKSNRKFGTSSHSSNSKSCIYLRCLHNQCLKWLSCYFSSRFLQKCSHVFISWFVFNNKVFKIRHLSLFYIKYLVSNYWRFGFYILYFELNESTIPIGSYRKLTVHFPLC